jgi:Zn-dependent protease
MAALRKQSLHLVRLAGIDVFLHWSWFIVAAFEISDRTGSYSSPIGNVLEYLALFLIVTVHEFGHALACRQTGGTANRIVLWPLGGVAYVSPPPRPGAMLWSIAAGPLVNVVLVPVLYLLSEMSRTLGWAQTMPDVYTLLRTVVVINLGLLIFNLLPIYPLDGGQILRSLLWFVMGRAASLTAATMIGMVGVVGLIALAVWVKSVWFGVLAIFILMNCWGGLQQARALSRLAKLPRRDGFSCPSCQSAPLLGAFWKCSKCQTRYDTFVSQATCPQCGAREPMTQCADCGRFHPVSEWSVSALTSPKQA